MAKTNDIPSVLTFEKKLVPSDGFFYGTCWDNKTDVVPLELREKAVRGTISNREESAVKNDPAKLNKRIESPNPQTIDTCALGLDQDTLKHQFTLKVLGGVEHPSACNKPTFRQSYYRVAREYIEREGCRELGRRYAHNIANARFLWRNRVGAEQIEVQVRVLSRGQDEQWTFDALSYSTRSFEQQDEKVDALGQKIASALASGDGALVLEITTFAQLGNAQEVYPSEELVMEKGKRQKSKILYEVNGQAAMHSQKIGNALRSIDTWYPAYGDKEQSAGAIAIEPYGAVTNLGKAYRAPTEKQDFYTLFDFWALGGQLDRVEDEHYVMAVLVRGGVFNQRGK